ncbi:MAG TPA: PHP domain-containing protein [Firmicutes bacterium]|nr:PHP domain-containing protein [Candidatus Fermentithermobacillaceae bacterium]
MAKRQVFRIDMHVHSMYSGETPAEPRDIIEAAKEKGLDAIVITEHERLSLSLPFEDLKKTAGRLQIFRGVELSTDAGHMLVYGVRDEDWKDWGAGRLNSAQEVIERAARLGGVAVPAHPYVVRKKDPFDTEPAVLVDDRITSLSGLKAIEVCNGKHSKYPGVCEALGKYAASVRLPGIGGSDAHMPEDVGRAYTSFKVPIYTDRDLVREILRGNVVPQTDSLRLFPARISAFVICEISM